MTQNLSIDSPVHTEDGKGLVHDMPNSLIFELYSNY